MDILDDKRLSIFLIEFAKFDKTLPSDCYKYLQLMMKVNQAGSAKKFERQLQDMRQTIEKTNEQIN